MIIYLAGSLTAVTEPKYNEAYEHILLTHFDTNEKILDYAMKRRAKEKRLKRLKVRKEKKNQ